MFLIVLIIGTVVYSVMDLYFTKKLIAAVKDLSSKVDYALYLSTTEIRTALEDISKALGNEGDNS